MNDIAVAWSAWARELKQITPHEIEHRPSLQDLTPQKLYELNMHSVEWSEDELRNVIRVEPFDHCGRCTAGHNLSRDDKGYEHSRPCEHCRAPYMRARRIHQAQLPPDAVLKVWSNYELSEHRESDRLLNAYWQRINQPFERLKPLQGLLMCGSAGTGKSHYLYAVAHRLAWQGLRVRYATHMGLLDAERATWNDKHNQSSPLRDIVRDYDVLLIDEIGGTGGGSGSWSQWVQRATSELLDTVYRQWAAGRLRLVCASNLSPEKVQGLYNPALQSRVQQMLSPVIVDGEDRRQKK